MTQGVQGAQRVQGVQGGPGPAGELGPWVTQEGGRVTRPQRFSLRWQDLMRRKSN